MKNPKSKIYSAGWMLGLLIVFASPFPKDKPKISQSEAMQRFWKRQQDCVEKEPNKVFSEWRHGFDPSSYPSESAISFLSAWKVTGKKEYLRSAIRQLEFAHNLENRYHLLPQHQDKPFVARISQARLCIGYVVAYFVVKDKLWISRADDAFEGLLLLKQTKVRWKNQEYQVFYHGYQPNPPFAPISKTFLNPNQDAAVGLCATLLYHIPKSRFFQKSNLAKIAHNSLDASIALQNEYGTFPEAQTELDHIDTRYGHHTLFWIFWANTYWKEKTYDYALRKSLPWIVRYTQKGTTLRYAPNFYDGQMPDPPELWCRLPILYYYKQDLRMWKITMKRLWQDWEDFADFPGGFVAPICVLDEMKIPRDL